MRNYQLYLIEDEFAAHYFGKEQMFFQLFQEHEQSTGEFKDITQKQINYITKRIPVLKIHQMIQKQLGKVRGFTEDYGTYMMELSGKLSSAYLRVFENKLEVKANGTLEAETVFFEVLRKSEASFLAIDLEHFRFGWLKPYKERKLI
ncbi:sporulation inhibitor of replication protein SirA [Bacillus sp. EB600]|uniref:sporulation inhibitor of replication protein SirA n=1 Tax=Bacillus sp. EB600 TaxID=2806345 RepID=UPI00210C9D77|nr:sporulation inhibitor of replication protein SirA [Bacillus sp. EB600]MCQ6280068.1 sporulation inhibitor of replication protein SirA [Bacillus sp. EB600]